MPRQKRQRDWSGLSAVDVLARHPPGKTSPGRVLEILLNLFNDQHTAYCKGVSHSTQHDRAVFLRRFFRDLRAEAGFPTIPDPRNLGGRHIKAMVEVWRARELCAATLHNYFSFLRALAWWIGKPGLVCPPRSYGLAPKEHRRHHVALRDKTWTGAGVAIEPLIAAVHAHDPHVGAALALIHAFGLRRKEAIMLRPHLCEVLFASTGLPPDERQSETYLWIRQGSKGGRQRFLPIVSDRQRQALELARSLAHTPDAHMGHPDLDLRANLNRFSNVVRRFGVSQKKLGITAHGLRHEALVDLWVQRTGTPPPVRGGKRPSPELMEATRQEIAHIAGHNRLNAANHYIGSWRRPAKAASDRNVAMPVTQSSVASPISARPGPDRCAAQDLPTDLPTQADGHTSGGQGMPQTTLPVLAPLRP